ncbi:hypothetical protein SELMODRAFT_424533 [Selaginella moellendorffii]|uniref:Uncharacterized protein n=1 Tax=Selaginella moellendorffii TaxID=88036 RepID=D8SQ79_SELML|nr:hypothetical protein SELMODRAFT_424533 [Selaginella moellendorffii]
MDDLGQSPHRRQMGSLVWNYKTRRCMFIGVSLDLSKRLHWFQKQAWEVGHTNNVSCVMFHTAGTSNSSLGLVQAFCRTNFQEGPEMNFLATGQGSGIIVFKLERERPAYTISAGVLYYVKEKALRTYDFATSEDTSLINIRRAELNQRRLSCNPAENAVLLCSARHNSTYKSREVMTLRPKKASGSWGVSCPATALPRRTA